MPDRQLRGALARRSSSGPNILIRNCLFLRRRTRIVSEKMARARKVCQRGERFPALLTCLPVAVSTHAVHTLCRSVASVFPDAPNWEEVTGLIVSCMAAVRSGRQILLPACRVLTYLHIR